MVLCDDLEEWNVGVVRGRLKREEICIHMADPHYWTANSTIKQLYSNFFKNDKYKNK